MRISMPIGDMGHSATSANNVADTGTSAFKSHPLLKKSNMSSSEEAIALIPHVPVSAPLPRLKDFASPDRAAGSASNSPRPQRDDVTATSLSRKSSLTSTPLSQQQMSATQIQELIQRAIQLHESDNLSEAFRLYCLAAQQNSAIGLFLSGLALRHGWGCAEDKALAFACLEHAAENAIHNIELLRRGARPQSGIYNSGDTQRGTLDRRKRASKLSSSSNAGGDAPIANIANNAASNADNHAAGSTLPRLAKALNMSGGGTTSSRNSKNSADLDVLAAATGGEESAVPAAMAAANDDTSSLAPMDSLAFQERMQAQISKFELAMSVYEIGQCYRFGWGVRKSKPTAVFYYRLAADLGDMDAQTDLAMCYLNGKGVKANRYLAASYFRLAALQGRREYGDTWIYKEKYSVFFRKNFRTFAILEDSRSGKPLKMTRSTSNLDGNTENTSTSARRSLNILLSIQTYMYNMQ